MTRTSLIFQISLIMMLSATADRAADSTDESPKLKCPYSKKPIGRDIYAKFKGKRVYFCCNNCVALFNRRTDEINPRVYHQLLQTKQISQISCPLTSKPLDEMSKMDIDGATVRFCCEDCVSAVKDLKDTEKVDKLFGKPSNSFSLQIKCPVCSKAIDPQHKFNYEKHDIFFHSKECRDKFTAKPADFKDRLDLE